mmetsp:Transcript_13962/g.28123  ORF Transcript_13962/g.28123 Transcript_13962/m.28123 type:complete len:127 (+) Transcript_13962:299-679(+)
MIAAWASFEPFFAASRCHMDPQYADGRMASSVLEKEVTDCRARGISNATASSGFHASWGGMYIYPWVWKSDDERTLASPAFQRSATRCSGSGYCLGHREYTPTLLRQSLWLEERSKEAGADRLMIN